MSQIAKVETLKAGLCKIYLCPYSVFFSLFHESILNFLYNNGFHIHLVPSLPQLHNQLTHILSALWSHVGLPRWC